MRKTCLILKENIREWADAFQDNPSPRMTKKHPAARKRKSSLHRLGGTRLFDSRCGISVNATGNAALELDWLDKDMCKS